jgi:hypothetical protein
MPDTPSAFDVNGHVELTNLAVMAQVYQEVLEGQVGKWEGNIHGVIDPADATPIIHHFLELNPYPARPERPGLQAFVGDHLQKMPFGVIMKITPAEYADYLATL